MPSPRSIAALAIAALIVLFAGAMVVFGSSGLDHDEGDEDVVGRAPAGPVGHAPASSGVSRLNPTTTSTFNCRQRN
jgi:hypothetical protein